MNTIVIIKYGVNTAYAYANNIQGLCLHVYAFSDANLYITYN